MPHKFFIKRVLSPMLHNGHNHLPLLYSLSMFGAANTRILIQLRQDWEFFMIKSCIRNQRYVTVKLADIWLLLRKPVLYVVLEDRSSPPILLVECGISRPVYSITLTLWIPARQSEYDSWRLHLFNTWYGKYIYKYRQNIGLGPM